MKKSSMYVVFLYDPKSYNKDGSLMPKGLYECFKNTTVYCKDSCFNSKNEAKRYISKLLRERRMTGGRLRPDITRKCFVIKQVYCGKSMREACFMNKKDVL
jgi:hypothetical protein